MFQTPDDEIVALANWLVEADFKVIVTRGPEAEAFGNRVIDLVRRRLKVRITRDRGQGWIDIGADGIQAWCPIARFQGWVDEASPSIPDSFEEQVSILRERLPDFEAALTDCGRALKYLRRLERLEVARYHSLYRKFGPGSVLSRWWSTLFGRHRGGLS